MPDDVFGKTNADATANPLADLVGEGKKFKSVEDLAAGKLAADSHISNLEKELAELRAQVNPQFDAEKQLADLRAEIQALKANPPSSRSPEVTPQPLTEDRIAALVQDTITRAERNRTSQQNIMDANAAVVEHFGSLEAAGAATQQKAAEAGLSLDELKSIAAKSPSAFKKIVLGEPGRANENPLNPQSNNTAVVPPNAGGPKPGTKEFFDQIFKTDRRKYFTPEVQMALHKAAAEGTYQL